TGAFTPDGSSTVPEPLVLAWTGAQTLTVAGMAMAVLLLGLVGWGVRLRPALWAAGLMLVPGLPLVALLGLDGHADRAGGRSRGAGRRDPGGPARSVDRGGAVTATVGGGGARGRQH